MEPLSLNKYINIIIKKWKLLAIFAAVSLVLALIYGLFIFKPVYKSNAKVMIKANLPKVFVADIGYDTPIASPGGQNKNPILTQIEVLSSKDMAENVWEKIKKDVPFNQYPKDYLVQALTKVIQLENPLGTDIIDLTILWINPEDSQKIANAYVNAYYDYNVNLNKKSVSQTKSYINDQLKESTLKLKNLREKLKKFRKDNLSVDINVEALSVINQITNVENLISEINSNIDSEKGKIEEISSKLGIDLEKAINSVALGQSINLSTWQKALHEAQQQYATLNVKYPSTTPQMKSIEANINEIKSQISEQALVIIGHSPNLEENSIISDSVRTQMVNDLVKSHTELQAFSARKKSLKNTLESLKNKQNSIPEKKQALASLLEQEENLSNIVKTLNTKLIEAKIKESEIVSNVSIIQNATLPKDASFPTMFHILLIFVSCGSLLGVGLVIGLHFLEDTCYEPSEMEEILGAPVIGSIPWLSESSYNDVSNGYKPASIVGIVYQKITTSLKVRCQKSKINALAVSSADFEKKKPVISVNIAKNLAQSNDSVILIDADLRDSYFSSIFKFDSSTFPDLTDCLSEVSKKFSEGRLSEIEQVISSHIIQIPNYKNLFIIPTSNKNFYPFTVLNSDAFPLLIKVLKTKFDFVVVDTPPILAVPDSINISQHLDGLLVLSGIKTSRSNLRQIRKICADNYINVVGTISRENTNELKVPENQYIKQLSS